MGGIVHKAQSFLIALIHSSKVLLPLTSPSDLLLPLPKPLPVPIILSVAFSRSVQTAVINNSLW